MALTGNSRIGLVAALVTVLVVSSVVGFVLLNPAAEENSVKVTLLTNAGVMLEAQGLRIYIDPYRLPDNYTDLPADAILITHPHGDHYQESSIELIETEDTVFIMPENMTTEVTRHDAIGVNPGDSIQVGTINITAFYMYTVPVEVGDTIYPASHPAEANWTSYIVDIGGFTIFHAGDTKDIPEHADLEGLIDVAFIPLGPGCQTCYEDEVVDIVDMIKPAYFVGMHYATGYNDDFEDEFGEDIAAINDCVLINMEYWSSHTFQIE